MPNRLLTALLASALAAPLWIGSAAAQTAETDTFDLGETVEPSQPREYLGTVHGDWQMQCLELPDTEDFCQMYQPLTGPDGGTVAEARIFRLPEGGQAVAGGAIIAPLETLLTQRLTMSVDGGAPRRYEFAFCTVEGCVARIGFTQAEVDAFRAGAVADVTIVPAMAPDQVVTVPMSLTGFTAAYDEVSVAPAQ